MYKEDEDTCIFDLEDEIISDALAPFYSLMSVVNDMGEDMYNLHDLMEIVMEKVEKNIVELFKLVESQVGLIQVQKVKNGHYVDFEGQRYSGLQKFRAFLEPTKEEEAGPLATKTEASREDLHQAVRTFSKFKDDPAAKLMDKLIDISLQDEAGRIPPQVFEELEARMTAIVEEAIASAAA